MGLGAPMSTGNYVRILLLAFSNFALAQNGAYTIFNTPNYAQQQTCLQNYFTNYGDNGSKLPCYLGCAWDGYKFLDACVCKADLAPSASAFLTKCVILACSLYPANVATAISLYNSYCSTPGGNLATTTLGGLSTAQQ